jgi:dethiobiotin synthetase
MRCLVTTERDGYGEPRTDGTLPFMTEKRPLGFFITGTGTGVGKTFVSAALARTLVAQGMRVGVYKPVLSGCLTDLSSLVAAPDIDSADDDVVLWKAADRPGKLQDVSPQRFQAALAPNLAARAEGKKVDGQLLRTGLQAWQSTSDCILVEGAGGLFSPVTDNELNADLAFDLGFPVVIVAPNSLGVIHATLATLFAARSYRGGLQVAGIVLNDLPTKRVDASTDSNYLELVRLCAPCQVLRHSPNATHLRGLID